VTTEVNHSDLTGSDLHPPLGTSESASALAIADVNNSILVEDSSGYDVVRVNLVDDEIVIGSSSRPINLKVYDPTSGTDAVVALGSGIAAPRGIMTTLAAGTFAGLWQFQGDRVDDSGNGYNLSLGGPAGGVARYAHLHAGGGSREGVVLLGDTYLWRATSGAANLDISGALTLEILCAPLNLTQNANTDLHLSQFAYIFSLADGTFGSPLSNARYSAYAGLVSASAAYLGYAHESATPASISSSDPCPALPGMLQHLCWTRDSAGTGLNIYVNGYLRHSATLAAAPGGTAGDTFAIGTINNNAAGYTFRGWIGGAAVIAGELSAAQVLARANYALGL
jgi:hypothetical protein